MTQLKAHFDGQRIVLDEPAPPELAPNTKVTILVPNGDESVLERIAKLAVDSKLPTDFSAQHDHYVKGAPRR